MQVISIKVRTAVSETANRRQADDRESMNYWKSGAHKYASDRRTFHMAAFLHAQRFGDGYFAYDNAATDICNRDKNHRLNGLEVEQSQHGEEDS